MKMKTIDSDETKKIKRKKKMGRREIELIGKQLPKSKGYYEWCKKHNIDPDSGVVNGNDKKE